MQKRKKKSDVSFLVMSKDQRWEPGQELKVYFDTTDKASNIDVEKVLQIAKKWESYCFIKLTPTLDRKESNIRVAFNENYFEDSEGNIRSGTYSYTGKDCKLIPLNEETMNYSQLSESNEQEYNSHILHEFGHALGFLHELQHPFDQIPWDIDAVYKYYKQEYDWDREIVDEQVLNQLNKYDNEAGSSHADLDSIMCYQINSRLIQKEYRELYSNTQNYKLSKKDKYKARIFYHYPLESFKIGQEVTLKSTQQVVKQFNFVRRDDYNPQLQDKYNEQKGTIIQLHSVNGLLIQFSDGQSFWYEPECVNIQLSQNSSGRNRFFNCQYVTISDRESPYYRKKGEVQLTDQFKTDEDYKLISVLIDEKETVQFLPQQLQRTYNIYDIDKTKQVSIGLENLRVGDKVQILDKEEVQNSFEFVRRTDYRKSIEDYVGQIGEIVALHPTNGALVKLEDDQFWLEPGSIKVTTKGKGQNGCNFRCLPAELVIIKATGKQGKVLFHQNDDLTKITVAQGQETLIIDPKEVKLFVYTDDEDYQL